MAIEGLETRGDLERFIRDQLDGSRLAAVVGQVQGRTPAEATALPASPADGQEVYVPVDDAGTNGGPVLWHMRYRAAVTGWQFVGGDPLLKAVDTNEGLAITLGTWGDLATLGPDITVPFAGDYYVEFGATMDVGANGQEVMAGVAQAAGGTPVGRLIRSTIATAVKRDSQSQLERFTGLAASGLLRMRYQPAVVGGGAPSARYRWLRVWPWRLT